MIVHLRTLALMVAFVSMAFSPIVVKVVLVAMLDKTAVKVRSNLIVIFCK